MRLIEPITGELLHQVEDSRDLFLVFEAFGSGAAEKLVALGRHLFRFLLAHGAAQQIRFTE